MDEMVFVCTSLNWGGNFLPPIFIFWFINGCSDLKLFLRVCQQKFGEKCLDSRLISGQNERMINKFKGVRKLQEIHKIWFFGFRSRFGLTWPKANDLIISVMSGMCLSFSLSHFPQNKTSYCPWFVPLQNVEIL